MSTSPEAGGAPSSTAVEEAKLAASRVVTLQRVVDHLRTRALYTPGVFRVTANMTEVRELLRRCDEGNHACLAECDDNHMVAGLLLEVLREMPTSLFDFEEFLALSQPGNFADVGKLVMGYTPERREMVRSVVHLLRCLHVNAAANEVNISHLVSIFSPVLCRPPSGAFMSIRHIKALPHIQTALHTLIQHYDLVFRRANAWSAQAEAESYHHQVLVLAITEELLDGTVNSFFGNLDISSPSHITDEPARWAEVLPSPRKARRSSSQGSDSSPLSGGRGAGAGAGAGAGSGGGVLSGDGDVHMRLTDVDTFNLSDDEDGGGGGGSGGGSGKRSESGSGGEGSGGSGKEADGEAGASGDADAGSHKDDTGTGRGVQRAAAAGLSLNISTSAQPVSAPVSPPTPWVTSPSLAPSASQAAASRDSGASDHPRRPSGALRRKQVSEYRKVRVQVKRFEESYRAKHGVVPKGKARAPVKELYNRYRHLKQVVRDGSALHIQTMYRGFRVRKAHGKVPARAARTRSTSSQQGSKAAASDAGAKRSDRAGSVDSVIDREAFDDRRGAAGQATSAVESIPALKADKSSLKKQLKQFDIDFKAKHGRMPTNDDKEPIRHLYRRYAELKDAIAELEAEAAWTEGGGGAGSSESSHDAYRALRREKRMLQLKLKTYEDEFQRLTGRKVRYHKDIRPVEAEYQRYKEVKAQINELASKQKAGSVASPP